MGSEESGGPPVGELAKPRAENWLGDPGESVIAGQRPELVLNVVHHTSDAEVLSVVNVGDYAARKAHFMITFVATESPAERLPNPDDVDDERQHTRVLENVNREVFVPVLWPGDDVQFELPADSLQEAGHLYPTVKLFGRMSDGETDLGVEDELHLGHYAAYAIESRMVAWDPPHEVIARSLREVGGLMQTNIGELRQIARRQMEGPSKSFREARREWRKLGRLKRAWRSLRGRDPWSE